MGTRLLEPISRTRACLPNSEKSEFCQHRAGKQCIPEPADTLLVSRTKKIEVEIKNYLKQSFLFFETFGATRTDYVARSGLSRALFFSRRAPRGALVVDI